MRFYKFTGKGLALSASVIVKASSEKTALKLAMDWAVEHGVPPDTIQLEHHWALSPGAEIIDGWNGDY